MSDHLPSTALNLLADDGIIHVTFQVVLTPEQYVELTQATAAAPTVRALADALLALGQAWEIVTVTKIVSQKPTAVNRGE